MDLGEVRFDGQLIRVRKNGLVWGISHQTGWVLHPDVPVVLSCYCARIVGEKVIASYPRREVKFLTRASRKASLLLKVGGLINREFLALQGARVYFVKKPKNVATCPDQAHWSLEWVHRDEKEEFSYFYLHQVGIGRSSNGKWLITLRAASAQERDEKAA